MSTLGARAVGFGFTDYVRKSGDTIQYLDVEEGGKAFTKEASYIIGKVTVDGVEYVKAWKDGEEKFSDTDASTVIQQAIDALTQGLVLLKEKYFDITTTLSMKNDIALLGLGTKGTIFTSPNLTGATVLRWSGGAAPVVDFDGVRNAKLGGLHIYLNNVDGAVGVRLNEASENLVEDVGVSYGGSGSKALRLTSGGVNFGSLFNHFNRVKALGVDKFIELDGLSGYAAGDNHFHQCEAQSVLVGVDHVKYADHNVFYDLWLRLNKAGAVGVKLNSDSTTASRGVYANHYYGLVVESNQDYTGIECGYITGMFNKFITPIFEEIAGVTATPYVFNSTTHRNLMIVSDSKYNVDHRVYGGFVSLPYASVISQPRFLCYVPSGTALNAGVNTFTFLHQALVGDGKGIIKVHLRSAGGIAANLLNVFGRDNSASVANQGIIYVLVSAAVTLASHLEMIVEVEKSTLGP